MGVEEQDAAILFLVKARAEAKRQLEPIEKDIRQSIANLTDALDNLNRNDIRGTCESSHVLPVVLRQLESASSEKLALSLRQFSDLAARIRQYDATARELGID